MQKHIPLTDILIHLSAMSQEFLKISDALLIPNPFRHTSRYLKLSGRWVLFETEHVN